MTGAVALGFVSLAVVIHTLQDYNRLRAVYGPISVAMLVAAGASLVVGYWQPSPLLLVVSLVAIHSAVWWVGVRRMLAADTDLTSTPESPVSDQA